MAEAGYPVSIKGVLIRDDRVMLVHNERDEWELPGGRIEPGETPEQTVAREITEESGLPVDVAEILDAWMYHIDVAGKDVFIVTYGCTTTSDAAPVVSHEHNRIGEFAEHEVVGLRIPEGYKRSIAAWFGRLRILHPALQRPRSGANAAGRP
ncbi:NUDIX hydrolase [Amycolatopsis sp. NPDC048633]|uniref:NUDIX hydrolase n=1 Tax=Amycolatopsis sp. NPDC048633 TaxID=3157095 RepID=UPI0033F6873A